ncbi:MAG TPA: hypothetical protein VGC80_18260, partial [Acetobacteraceae bacterium]
QPMEPTHQVPRMAARHWTAPVLAACLAIAGVLAAGAWQGGWLARAPAPPHMSIAVLPFQNLGGEPGEDYLADAITDDLTTDLSHIEGAFVVARNSAANYRERPATVQRMGLELGVRYVLEGSVRKLGSTMRVNAQLIATETGAQVWSDRFDEEFGDIAAGQNQVVRRIGSVLGFEMIEMEAARSVRDHPDAPDVFDLVLRGRALRNLQPSRRREAEALALFEQALRQDPSSVAAKLGIASTLVSRSLGFIVQWTTADELERAAGLVADARGHAQCRGGVGYPGAAAPGA